MSPEPRLKLLRFLLPLLTTALAVVIARAVQPWVTPSVTPPFILAVAAAALYGGRWPGGAAAVLGALALVVWFLPPTRPEVYGGRIAMFLVVSGVVTLIAGKVHDQRRRAIEEASEHDRLRGAAERAASEAREAESALRQRESELLDFFETASTPLQWTTEDGTIVRANDAELQMLGYGAAEYIGRRLGDFDAEPAGAADLLRRVRAGETVRQQPARVRCKDGQLKHVVMDASGYFDGGRLQHVRVFSRDVTEERQAHEAMARLAAIVTGSSDAIVGKTLEGVVTSWNAAAERIFGYPAADMVGQSIFRLIPPELHDDERRLLERIRRGETVEFSETERIRSDGRRIWISLSVSPLRDRDGTIIGAASIKRDITERRVLEERLRDTQRLQAVGQLAGGIAHEANNQMSVVLGGAHFLLRRTDLPPSARADVEQIRLAAERTASITQQLLAFSRRQILQLQDVGLNEVVQTIGPVLRRTLSEDQQLVVRLGLLERTLRADPRQLEQVLLNLTLNARDAMPSGGQLAIETAEGDVSGRAASAVGISPGFYQVLTVRDSGVGMAETTLEHIFEPFFTTKAIGQGTGLGLSVVHGIVAQSGGHIAVESRLGQGTTFRLYFPVSAAPAPGAGGVPEPGSRPPAPGTVALVVEDDAMVRTMAGRALMEAGYEVVEAENGEVALEAARRRRFDIVVTDIGMPTMDGFRLAQCLTEEQPGLPVIYMTGYGDHAADSRRQRVEGRTLFKPFSPDALVEVVGEVLSVR